MHGIIRRIRTRMQPPMVAAERSCSYYDGLYSGSGTYQTHYRQSHYYFLWTVIADRLRRRGVERVLEIGCGPGQLAQLLYDQGIRSYTGLDFSETALEIARRNVPSGQFVLGDARATTVHEAAAHDAIICTEVLEHVNEDLAILGRFGAGKYCICSVPNFPHESHVRQFRTADEVAERYGRWFAEFDVITLPSPMDAADFFYLFDGVRNDVQA